MVGGDGLRADVVLPRGSTRRKTDRSPSRGNILAAPGAVKAAATRRAVRGR